MTRFDMEKLSRLMGRLAQAGWFPGSSGNFSVFSPEEGRVYIKATGAYTGGAGYSDIIIIDLKGNVLEGSGSPSKEYRFHLGIYRSLPELRVVIHGHPPYATAYAISQREMPLVTEPAKVYLKKVPLVEYAPSGSEELASHVINAFKDPEVRALLIKGHGVVCAGKDLDEAVNIAEWLEDNAREAFLIYLLTRFTAQ